MKWRLFNILFAIIGIVGVIIVAPVGFTLAIIEILKPMNGKGSRPRSNYSKKFRNNYDKIKWRKKK